MKLDERIARQVEQADVADRQTTELDHAPRLNSLESGHAQRGFQSPVEGRIPSIPACAQATETADTHISHYNNVRCQLAATEVAGRLSDVTAYTLANETRPDTWQ